MKSNLFPIKQIQPIKGYAIIRSKINISFNKQLIRAYIHNAKKILIFLKQ